MLSLHEDHGFQFRFVDDRIITRIHLEGVETGRLVSVFKTDVTTGERISLLATAIAAQGGWVDLPEPLIVRAGDELVAIPGNTT